MNQDLIDDLLARWERSRQEGKPLKPADLCKGHPELLGELCQAIKDIEAADAVMVGFRPSRAAFHAGDEPVPGYRLVEELGAGSYGRVWKALAPGGVPVALKMIPAQVARKEEQALNVVTTRRHPNLLTVAATWRTADWYIVQTELADGTLLDYLDLYRKRKLRGVPYFLLLAYMQDVARALDYLHALRIVDDGLRPGLQHRDVKPDNIFVVGTGAKLGDFTFVQAMTESVTPATSGKTYLYAPPEVHQSTVHLHSDQFALAVTYCHCRTGQLPFTSLHEMQQIGPALADLEDAECRVLSRALSPDPEKRWPTCAAFVAGLSQAAARSSHPEDVLFRVLDQTRQGEPDTVIRRDLSRCAIPQLVHAKQTVERLIRSHHWQPHKRAVDRYVVQVYAGAAEVLETALRPHRKKQGPFNSAKIVLRVAAKFLKDKGKKLEDLTSKEKRELKQQQAKELERIIRRRVASYELADPDEL